MKKLGREKFFAPPLFFSRWYGKIGSWRSELRRGGTQMTDEPIAAPAPQAEGEGAASAPTAESGSAERQSSKQRFLEFLGMSLLPVLLSGVVRAIAIYTFVSPNSFAPGGFNGLSVILEYITHLSSGYFLLIFNVPLFFLAFFLLGKREAIISTASMLLTSGLLIVFDQIPGFPTYGFTEEGDMAATVNGLLAAIASGLLLGFSLAVMLRSCGTSGGTSVIASVVNKKWKFLSVSWMTFCFDAVVVFASFFVYHRGASFTVKLDPVLLALVSLFVTSKTSDAILHGFKIAYKFEIVTNAPEEIASEIMAKLHHGVTRMSAEGMYSHTDKSMLVCIIRKRQIAELQRIIKQYPDTFAYFSPTSEVYGKFLK